MQTEEIKINAPDGFTLTATGYLPPLPKAVVIIHSATAVPQRFYAAFAKYLVSNNIAAFTYDYRGTGQSGPARLPAGFADSYWAWGTHDADAVARYVVSRFQGLPLAALGHSIGGVVLGFSPTITAYNAIITYGAQTAYYKDWSPHIQPWLYAAWHGLLPLASQVFGYVPGRLVGKGATDVSKGVMRDWHRRRLYPDAEVRLKNSGIATTFHDYNGPLLCLGTTDDPIATPKALRRLHAYFSATNVEERILVPATYNLKSIGHFGLLRKSIGGAAWPELNHWLQEKLLIKP